MESKIKEAVALIGLEIGEKFLIEGEPTETEFFVVTNGQVWFENEGFKGNSQMYNLGILLDKPDIIVKLPFKPAGGETYWTYSGDWTPDCERWTYAAWEYPLLKVGCVFRTKEEALAARPQKFRELTGREWPEDAGN